MRPETIAKLPEVLVAYLSERLPDVRDISISNLARSTGGASRAMWFFDADWTGDTSIPKTLTIRCDESTVFRDSEYSLKGEFDVHKALEPTDIPVIPHLWYEDDPRWIGEPFVIHERIGGTSNLAGATPEELQRILAHFVEIMAAWHSLDWREAGLEWLGVPSDPAVDPTDSALRLLDTWEAVMRRESLSPDPLMAAAMRWLRQNVPSRVDRISLGQGQVGPGQFMHDGTQVTAIIDWEQAFLGDPMSDLAYFAITTRAMAGDQWDDLMKRYTKISGVPIREENFTFYSVFQTFWMATAAITAKSKFASGEVPHVQSVSLGLFVDEMVRRRLLDLITK